MSAPGLQAVHAVGGVVPPGLLARIQAGELTDKTGLDPKTYHLPGRETVRDAASRAWSYLRGAWSAWRDYVDTQPPGSPGTGPARERWLLVLLRELGYGQLPPLPSGITVTDRNYPVSHAWQHVPVHLLGPGVDLDKRNPHVTGATRAPQAMVQELLNRSDQHLWAILSNGSRLRLLRDSTALAGSAYLEFDLDTIFAGELYPEFLLLWQLCHVSRLEKRGGPDTSPADCWLETWRTEAVDAGARALDRLRDGVEAALVHLGTGFLRHPSNTELTHALRDGTLTTEHYHRGLLRLAYRLLFVFVTEDRDLLLRPLPASDSPDFATVAAGRDRYTRYFSTGRLRRLSGIRAGSPHTDLWQAQRLVFQALGDHGHDGLALPALAGLFDPDPRQKHGESNGRDLLLGCHLANEDFLAAVRALAWVELPGQRVQPVDYRNLGAEELGSVYESLLELVPQVDLPARVFRLQRLAGNERKTTGSYYTPPSLVSALLDSALDPVLDEAVFGAADVTDGEKRLLAVTVCDPSCGSGHFLVAAARRIARRLAQLRSGEDEPTPKQVRHALRDVVGTCVYGVDINDLAAELAKVSLWMEALEPGKPLGFLDARIRVGNSLLGVTPPLLDRGVPSAAFEHLEGDDKKYAAAMRKRNKETATGQGMLLGLSGGSIRDVFVDARREAIAVQDDVDKVRDQQRHWLAFESSPTYLGQKLHADAWCAAFVWPLRVDTAEPPVDAVVTTLRDDPHTPVLEATVRQVRALTDEYVFFHWHLEFPEIFDEQGNGGFRCVLGNPPWERVKLQEKEFFAGRDDTIAKASNAAARKKRIAALASSDSRFDQDLLRDWQKALRRSSGISHFIRESGRYPLTATGDINTYAVFAETARLILHPRGKLGIIVPTGVATDSTTQHFFKDMVLTKTLVSLFDFENEEKIFPGVDHRVRFSLLTTTGTSEPTGEVRLAFRLRQAHQIATHAYGLTPEEITLMNPNTGTCPVFVSRRDAEITLGIYRRVPVLWGPEGNPWGLTFMAMFHMANDSGIFRTAEELEADGWTLDGNTYRPPDSNETTRMLPLYEAKMAHHYDHRFSTYHGATQEQLNVGALPRLDDDAHADPAHLPLPRYWVEAEQVDERLDGDAGRGRTPWGRSWLLGWRDICRSTDARTLIVSVLPRTAVGDKFLLAFPSLLPGPYQANLSSIVVDYVTRQKYSGTSLKYYVMRQIAMLAPVVYEADAPWDENCNLGDWITSRVLELNYTSYDLQGYARELGDVSSPFRWEPHRREVMRAELDAGYFHLYGLGREEVDYVMDTFRIVAEREFKAYGEFRTKRLILEIYDAMRKAIDAGVAFQTVLDPPPGHGPRHPEQVEA
ncbi:Eco57I restriction-modification methylase domain-containing protein [Actinoplanes regularis]|uniref:site-specific DNA-methyltransferase (adenine-specific) n=1 Tax=Actinoplanes regularis TaxID=52697 RepID=A0A238XKX1_9ACTN|nr:DNA methyltransferase [Actinoplanes regularis]GIE90490.1 hypothetical protein Are01nite_69700 [Actinoplanes regularis]SNR58629.1 N-6 DNA Methylase [Actinoplanes regularis]